MPHRATLLPWDSATRAPSPTCLCHVVPLLGHRGWVGVMSGYRLAHSCVPCGHSHCLATLCERARTRSALLSTMPWLPTTTSSVGPRRSCALPLRAWQVLHPPCSAEPLTSTRAARAINAPMCRLTIFVGQEPSIAPLPPVVSACSRQLPWLGCHGLLWVRLGPGVGVARSRLAMWPCRSPPIS